MTNYAIYSEGGQELTQTSATYTAARRTAQTLADEMGETVYLDTVPSGTDPENDEDGGEAIAPTLPGADAWMVEDAHGNASGAGMTRQPAIASAQHLATRTGQPWYATHPTLPAVAAEAE